MATKVQFDPYESPIKTERIVAATTLPFWIYSLVAISLGIIWPVLFSMFIPNADFDRHGPFSIWFIPMHAFAVLSAIRAPVGSYFNATLLLVSIVMTQNILIHNWNFASRIYVSPESAVTFVDCSANSTLATILFVFDKIRRAKNNTQS